MDAHCEAFFTLCRVFCFIVVLFDPVYHCDNLAEKEKAGYFTFPWFVACVLSVLISFVFLLVSLVGYDL